MSRYHPDRNLAPLFDAAEVWRERCLIQDGSLFGPEQLWTLDHARRALTVIDQASASGEGNWVEQMFQFFANEPTALRRFLAEVFWLYYLFPRNLKVKLPNIERFWGQPLPSGHKLLHASVLAGARDTGTAYNALAWREFQYLLRVAEYFKAYDRSQREKLLAEPASFAAALDNLPEGGSRGARHILCYLLFPDSFEPILGFKLKRLILTNMGKHPPKPNNFQIDQLLGQLRGDLAKDLVGDFDFFRPDVQEKWKPKQNTWLMEQKLPDQVESGDSCELTFSVAPQTGDEVWLYDPARLSILARGNVADSEQEVERLPAPWPVILEVLRPALVLDPVAAKALEAPKRRSGLAALDPHVADQLRSLVAQRTAAPDIWPDQIAGPTNQIFFGPPGTGKTRRFEELREQYRSARPLPHHAWLKQQLQEATWWEVMGAAMLEAQKPLTVAELSNHPYISAKLSSPQESLTNNLTGTLQYHTRSASTTVNTARRAKPYIFDKDVDKKWLLLPNWLDDAPQIETLWQRCRSKQPESAVVDYFRDVTFHPSFGYEEFVEGFRPDPSGKLKLEPGIFRRLCETARANPQQRYALFIDEINRGNLSAILGELITLIDVDKRCVWGPDGSLRSGQETRLAYSQDAFGVPKNLDIYATMNTADRSLAQFDLALRRRFRFTECPPEPELLGKVSVGEVEELDLALLLTRLNQRITYLLDRDHCLGHGYFPIGGCDWSQLLDALYDKVIPLLQEYFHHDPGALQLVLGRQWVYERAGQASLFERDPDRADRSAYEVVAKDQVTPAIVRAVYT